jgi:GNAT superfamily N-acetyltransferase
MSMRIRAATEGEAGQLTALAMRAKAHWGYAPEALEGWRAELAVSAAAIRERPVFVAERGDAMLGFYSLRSAGGVCELFDLWVQPEAMGEGIGRALLDHARAQAALGGASELAVDADPNAEAFYLRCGAVRRGAVPAPIPGDPGRVRPQLAIAVVPYDVTG